MRSTFKRSRFRFKTGENRLAPTLGHCVVPNNISVRSLHLWISRFWHPSLSISGMTDDEVMAIWLQWQEKWLNSYFKIIFRQVPNNISGESTYRWIARFWHSIMHYIAPAILPQISYDRRWSDRDLTAKSTLISVKLQSFKRLSWHACWYLAGVPYSTILCQKRDIQRCKERTDMLFGATQYTVPK